MSKRLTDILPDTNGERDVDFDLPKLLDEFKGKKITIIGARLKKSIFKTDDGEDQYLGILKLDDGKEYRTSSTAIVDKIKEMTESIDFKKDHPKGLTADIVSVLSETSGRTYWKLI